MRCALLDADFGGVILCEGSTVRVFGAIYLTASCLDGDLYQSLLVSGVHKSLLLVLRGNPSRR
jgi:hypothetical protein